ncbi:MAG: PAS domain-containing protein [Rhizomicrobium sp.]
MMDFSALYRSLQDPDLIRLARYCEELTAAKPLPCWHDFRPSHATYLLGQLYVIELIDGGADYFFKLSGSYMKEIYGIEIVDRPLSSLPDGALKDTMRRNYAAVVASGNPVCGAGELVWPDERRIGVERMLIPFADEQGSLHTILGAVQCDVPLEILQLFRGNGPGRFIPHIVGARSAAPSSGDVPVS